MAVSGPPASLKGTSGKRADVVWFAVCFGLIGAWLAYLFLPYFLPLLKSSGSLLLGGAVVAGVVFAIVGALLVATFTKR